MSKLNNIFAGAVWLLLGFLLTSIGIAAAVQGKFIFCIGLPLGGAALALGIITLSARPYNIIWEDEGVEMSFVFRKDKVTWDQVEWYKNWGFRGNFRGGVNVWVVLKYRQATKGRTKFHKAVLLLPSSESFDSFSSAYYKTILDKYIPNKSRSRRRT